MSPNKPFPGPAQEEVYRPGATPWAYGCIAGLLASVLCIYTACPPSRALSSSLLSLISSEYSSL